MRQKFFFDPMLRFSDCKVTITAYCPLIGAVNLKILSKVTKVLIKGKLKN